MADTPIKSDQAPPVTDRRPKPTGVLPRHVQTWVMAGVAAGMVLIMFVVGRPDAPKRPTVSSAAVTAPDPARVRAFQDQLRTLESEAAQQAQAAAARPASTPTLAPTEPPTAAAPDPLADERKRRAYESLFASSVVLSRRPAADRPDAGREASTLSTVSSPAVGEPGTPSIDDIADAAVRATMRATPSPRSGAPSSTALTARASTTNATPQPPEQAETGPIEDTGPRYRLLEGTLIDAVLTNRLDGSTAAPVNCLVTTSVFSHNGQQILIPAGARLLGQTTPVQAFGETRLAVTFHRLEMPDGATYPLVDTTALNQRGDAGLHDQVNQHYLSTFGAAAAIGLVSGLSQAVGTAGVAGAGSRRTVVIAGGMTDATAQASAQTMNRFLNRLPTVTIREGHRIEVYLTRDLDLPAYPSRRLGSD